jgi:hypothetical protein
MKRPLKTELADLMGVYKGLSASTLRQEVADSIQSARFNIIRLIVALYYAATQNQVPGSIFTSGIPACESRKKWRSPK